MWRSLMYKIIVAIFSLLEDMVSLLWLICLERLFLAIVYRITYPKVLLTPTPNRALVTSQLQICKTKYACLPMIMESFSILIAYFLLLLLNPANTLGHGTSTPCILLSSPPINIMSLLEVKSGFLDPCE